MAIIKDGKLMNTKEDNELVNEWLAKQPKARLVDKATGRVIGIVPMVTMMSDYKWQLDALNHRLEHPENYQNEDIDATIAHLRKWLDEHTPEPNEATQENETIYVQRYQALREAI